MKSRPTSNQALERTADRREDLLPMTSTLNKSTARSRQRSLSLVSLDGQPCPHFNLRLHVRGVPDSDRSSQTERCRGNAYRGFQGTLFSSRHRLPARVSALRGIRRFLVDWVFAARHQTGRLQRSSRSQDQRGVDSFALMQREPSNHAMERTATGRAFTFSMITPLSLRATLALSGRRSSCSR